ncbi:MAG: hypothetical protein ACUVXA_16970 [Candidatus Jordarchaeum sp.]|uniref:hypothetical protein n=1 Tax=Candidatus Jordarchaeum sp. TaxID=2823881 RepID=UPI00404B49C2
MNRENLEKAITSVKETAKNTNPKIKKIQKLEDKIASIQKEVDKEREEALENLLNQFKEIPLFSIDELKGSILDTIKNSVKTKTGRILLKINKRNEEDWGVSKIGLTQKYFSFLYEYQQQIKDDGNIDDLYYMPEKELFEIREERGYRGKVVSYFPKSALTDLKIIDKEYVDKFCEFLVEYTRLKSKYDLEKNGEDIDVYDKNGIHIYITNYWDWDTKRYLIKFKTHIEWRIATSVSIENAITEINEKIEKVLNRQKEIRELYEKVKEFNAGRNLLRELIK